MSEEKKYSVLFIINAVQGGIKPVLPEICDNFIKKGHDVHIIYSSAENDEVFMEKTRNVPWIFVSKLPLLNRLTTKTFTIPFAIRKYIKRHEGIDIIHSFGLECGLLAYLSCIGLKAKTVNTPLPLQENNNKNILGLLYKFLTENVIYALNLATDKILFVSDEDRKNASKHISYRNAKADFVEIEDAGKLCDKLLEIYTGL